MNLQLKFLIAAGFLFLFISILNPYVVASSENSATLAVNEAEETLASTFKAIKEAEIQGADISGLSELLNDATQLLAEAHNSLHVKDFEKAENYANLAWEIGTNLKGTALSLEKIKSDYPAKELWDTIISSIIAAFIVIIVAFLSWTFFKKSYYRRISLKKPQVATFEL